MSSESLLTYNGLSSYLNNLSEKLAQDPPDKATLEAKRSVTIKYLIKLLETPYTQPEGLGASGQQLRESRYLYYKLDVLYLLIGFSDYPDMPLPETGPGSVQKIMGACGQLENQIAQNPQDLPHAIDSLSILLVRRYFASDFSQQVLLEDQISSFNIGSDNLPALWYRSVKEILAKRHSPLASFMKDPVKEDPNNH